MEVINCSWCGQTLVVLLNKLLVLAIKVLCFVDGLKPNQQTYHEQVTGVQYRLEVWSYKVSYIGPTILKINTKRKYE